MKDKRTIIDGYSEAYEELPLSARKKVRNDMHYWCGWSKSTFHSRLKGTSLTHIEDFVLSASIEEASRRDDPQLTIQFDWGGGRPFARPV